MIAELLRRVKKKENTLRELLGEIDAKGARVAEDCGRLTALIAKAEKEATLWEAGARKAQLTDVDQEDQLRAKEPSASHVSTASASASAGPTASVASQGSDVSDRIQAYITTQFGRLRDEIASDYDANRSTERLANDECHKVLGGFMREDAIFEAIQEPVDEAVEGVRDRMLSAWL